MKKLLPALWSRFGVFVKYGLGIGVLAWVIGKNWESISRVLERIDEFRWGWLSLAVAVNTSGLLITFVRWFILVRAQDLPFKLADALRLGLFGMFWSTFLPGSVTGDIPKAVFLAKEQSRQSVAVATIIIDRVIGLVGLFWLVTVVGAVFWATGSLEQMVSVAEGQKWLELIVLGATGILIGSLAFWFLLGAFSGSFTARMIAKIESVPKIGHPLAGLARAALMYRSRGKAVLLALLLAMVAHVGFVSTFYLCSLTLPSSAEIPTMRTHFLIVPVGMTFQAGFPTPGGIGGGEAAYEWLYKIVNADKADGVMACLMQRVLSWVLAGLGMLVYLFMKPATLPTKNELELDPMPAVGARD